MIRRFGLVLLAGTLAACARTDARESGAQEGGGAEPGAAAAARASAPAKPAPVLRRAEVSASAEALASARRAIEGIVRELRGPRKVGKSIQRAEVGFLARSLTTGQAVASDGADELLPAASNTKLFTTAAALLRLGPDFRFETSFRSGAPVRDGVLEGDLWVIGGGDPTLVSDPAWCPGGADGALGRVAEALGARGIRRVAGSLVLDDRLFADAPWHPGWPARDRGKAHALDVSALCAERHRLHVEASAHEGAEPEVFLSPRVLGYRVENRVRVVAKGPAAITARLDGSTLHVSGTVARGSSEGTSLPMLEGTRFFGAVALAAFAERGLAVDGGARLPKEGERPPGSEIHRLVAAAPLSEVVRYTNQESDNLLAEMILKTLGARHGGEGSFAAGVSVVRGVARDLGVPMAGFSLVDGSGLARDSKLSASALAALLAAMDRTPVASVFWESLAAGGGPEGTLRKRFREPIFAGRVRAKTGSLDGVSALSGYADSVGGERFVFSCLTSFERGGSAKADEERLVRELVRLGAR